MHASIHALASVAVARALFPKSRKAGMISAGIIGTISDVDWLSRFAGPSAFLSWHRTYTHSIVGAILLSAIIPAILLAGFFGRGWIIGVKVPQADLGADAETKSRRARLTLFGAVFAAALCAALLHIAMDACEADGVEMLWPFSTRRIALDWLPGVDPWIIAILIASLLLPELLHLVSSEIGARDKKPRGRLGAITGLALMLLYIGARATLHSNVVASLQTRTYQGEWPRRVAAFPEPLLIFTWRALVETDKALHVLTVNSGSGESFDPEAGLTVYKPEASQALDAARNAETAKLFVGLARFPKATVEQTARGYEVEFRDLRYTAAGATRDEIAAVIEIDAAGKIANQKLVWAHDLQRR